MASLNTPRPRQPRTSLAETKRSVIAVARGDLDRLDRYMVFLMPLVFASFYILPKTEQRYLLYVVCLLPMVLYVRPRVFAAVRHEPVWWLTVSLCALWVVSIAWSDNMTHESVFNALRIGFAVALFMHAGIWLAIQGKLPQQRIMTAILVAAGVTGALTICLALVPGVDMKSPAGRLVGFGWARHAGIGGDIFAFAGLIALVGLAGARRQGARTVTALALVLALCTFYTVLTESRGAVLAFVTAAALGVLLTRPKHLLTVAAGTALAAFAAYASGWVDFGKWVERGSAARIEIWAQALDWIQENPLLGVGAADITRIEVGRLSFNSVHNIFLAMTLDLGAVGLALFLALTVTAAWRAVALVRAGRGALLFTLLAFGYGVMQVHTQTVILMPAREWLIFWLPMLLLVQAHANRQRAPEPPHASKSP